MNLISSIRLSLLADHQIKKELKWKVRKHAHELKGDRSKGCITQSDIRLALK